MILQDSRIPSAMQGQLIDLYRRALEQGMPIDELEEKIARYLDRLSVTEEYESLEEKNREERLKKQVPKAIKYGAIILPLLFLSVGLYLVGSAVVPIVAYYVKSDISSSETLSLRSPIPKEDIVDSAPVLLSPVATHIAEASEIKAPTIINEQLDFTNLNNWFNVEALPELEFQNATAEYYTIDIPSLEIQQAKVAIGGTDLNKSLIQYPGTADPGQAGSPVIFGHSVLRQFYNPSEKNPQRYNSIFSYIMTMKPGDKIYITHGETKYTYVVREKLEIKPEDVYILNQDFGSKTLKLITCVPEGTYLRRGVVVAELVEQG